MLLHTSNLKFTHPGQPTLSFPDIKLDSKEAIVVLGQSGSGKTTLLNLLAGLMKPQSGEVLLDGTDLSTFSSQQMDQFRGGEIGIVFQKPHLISAISVLENLELANYFSKKKGQNLMTLLTELGIAQKANASVLTLSEGEAQRVSIARALVNNPKLILADEPTSSLDDEHAAVVVELLKSQAEKIGSGLVIVTHDQRVKAHFSKFIEVTAA
jgi:putative ABC transport system ATP-binding protein